MLYKGNQKIIGQTYTIQEIKKAIYPVGSVIVSFVIRDFTIEMPGTTWELEEEGRMIEATRDTLKVNTFVEAGLPNITGSLSPIYLKGDRNNVSKQGALKDSVFVENNWGGTNSGTATNLRELNFDASDSNSIYGASNTVQPKTRKYYVYRRIS